MPRLWILAGCVAALLGLGGTPADAAVDATLRQIGCLSASVVPGCTPSAGITGAERPAFSPDGAHLYVPGRLDDTVVDYTRDAATGALTRSGCQSIALAGCVAVAGLDGPSAAAVSPDGSYLYVVSTGSTTDGKLFVFHRVGGTLSIPVCFSAEVATDAPRPPAIPGLPHSRAPTRSSPATTRCTSPASTTTA